MASSFVIVVPLIPQRLETSEKQLVPARVIRLFKHEESPEHRARASPLQAPRIAVPRFLVSIELLRNFFGGAQLPFKEQNSGLAQHVRRDFGSHVLSHFGELVHVVANSRNQLAHGRKIVTLEVSGAAFIEVVECPDHSRRAMVQVLVRVRRPFRRTIDWMDWPQASRAETPIRVGDDSIDSVTRAVFVPRCLDQLLVSFGFVKSHSIVDVRLRDQSTSTMDGVNPRPKAEDSTATSRMSLPLQRLRERGRAFLEVKVRR